MFPSILNLCLPQDPAVYLLLICYLSWFSIPEVIFKIVSFRPLVLISTQWSPYWHLVTSGLLLSFASYIPLIPCRDEYFSLCPGPDQSSSVDGIRTPVCKVAEPSTSSTFWPSQARTYSTYPHSYALPIKYREYGFCYLHCDNDDCKTP
jgi:hypothetical protein